MTAIWVRAKFGDPAFSIAAPRLRNGMPGFIIDCKSIGAFNKKVLRHYCSNLLLI